MKKENQHRSYHSEPVQEIMGTVPSWITRWGVTVIFSILVLILVGCCVIRYPETLTGSVDLTSYDRNSCHGVVHLSSAGIGKVKAGQTVNVRLNGFPYMEFGIVKAVVSDGSPAPETGKDGRENYTVGIVFPDGLITTYGKRLPFMQGMDGEADVITDNRSLMDAIIGPMKSIWNNR